MGFQLDRNRISVNAKREKGLSVAYFKTLHQFYNTFLPRATVQHKITNGLRYIPFIFHGTNKFCYRWH